VALITTVGIVCAFILVKNNNAAAIQNDLIFMVSKFIKSLAFYKLEFLLKKMLLNFKN
jgi:hypothetical protein